MDQQLLQTIIDGNPTDDGRFVPIAAVGLRCQLRTPRIPCMGAELRDVVERMEA